MALAQRIVEHEAAPRSSPEGGRSVSTEKGKRQVVGLIGLGLDNKDGHYRLTQTEEALLLGGSQETHEAMQDVVIKFGESLRKRGKRLDEASVEEVIDLFNEAGGS
jgi:hypothetical protein